MDSYFLGLYEKSMPGNLTLREKMIEARRSGFDFLEISIDETDQKLGRLKWSEKERLDILKTSYDTGIKIMTMCLSGHRKYPIGSEDETTRRRGLEIMSDAIRLAVDIGIRVIQIAGYDEYYRASTENTRQHFMRNLELCTQMAAKYGVILAFETMETEFLNTVKKAMYYVDLINSPYLQIYPDLGNITNAALLYGHSVSDDLKSGRGHLAALHLKETKLGKFREIPYGTGHVNFEEAIQLAMEMGVRIYLAEFWDTGGDDWRQQLIFTNEFLRFKFENIIN